ncbi:MAG: S9 family peptidase [Rhodothermales bacterium]
MSTLRPLLATLFFGLLASSVHAQTDTERLAYMDVFELEYAADPQISPDGQMVVYVRTAMDVMTDRPTRQLWTVEADGSAHRPLVTDGEPSSPRWSPDGTRLLYAATATDGQRQLMVRWMDTGQTVAITNVLKSPGNAAWSPDGQHVAFTAFVPRSAEPLVSLPSAPAGAEWAKPARVITNLNYRSDGAGFLPTGSTHIFAVPAEGGTARQLTTGEFTHGAPAWHGNDAVVFSANRDPDYERKPGQSEVYHLTLDGTLTALTDRFGPDANPRPSPDGRHIAYTGYDDTYQGYHVTQLYVMSSDGNDKRLLTANLDRDINNAQWSADGRSLFFQYDDEGHTRLARVTLDGQIEQMANDVGGLSLGRPYGGGTFSTSAAGPLAFTLTSPSHPADVAVVTPGQEAQRLTHLNDDLFSAKPLGEVEEIWYTSSHDGQRVQGWIVKPPNFDASKQYPLILEIHGGPFANYGWRFSMEVQLFAAAGYVVLYTNPRGSTSYGSDFGNAIHHTYPANDYDDLMSGVDALIERGFIDPERLYVTGGSGGGVLTAWTIGNTDRFRAAVVAKPVINWASFVLTSDIQAFTSQYWFPSMPWEDYEHYWQRSPLRLVGNVTTPTMLLTGEADWRTPMTESEQYYNALQLRGIPSALVRIPDAGHGITARPSNLMAKVGYILAWFNQYNTTN